MFMGLLWNGNKGIKRSFKPHTKSN